MSILDLFTGGERNRAISYFSSLVKMAFSDGALEKKELDFLQKMAVKFNIEDAEFTRILENPEKHPIKAPLDYNDRIEQLYYFTQMIFMDETVDMSEVKLLRRLAVGIGFPVKNVEKVADEAIHLVMNKRDLEEFTEAIKTVNSQDIYD